jgi:hypothetical protein
MLDPRVQAAAMLAALSLALPACGGGGTATTTGGTGGHTSSGPTGSSSSGGSCAPTEESCDGVCADLSSDAAHCGTCGNACDAAGKCCAGVCVETGACAFSVTGAKPTSGWQNGGDWVTLTGQGFTAGMKVFLGDGRAAVAVLSPTTARIKTPPGPLGNADLKVAMGPSVAVLKQGFQYASAGLNVPWQQKQMTTVRGEDPGVTVMQDARVLITGGTLVPDSIAQAFDTAIVYTRMTDLVTDVTSTMSTPRWHDSAVTLVSGKVLVVGGACTISETTGAIAMCNGDPLKADLFDPATNTFTPTKGALNVARAYTRAVLLPDGRVLVGSANDPSVEVYDPDQDSFTLIQSPNPVPHIFGYMVMLRDGRALLGGGDNGNANAEVFDPDTSTLTAVGAMTQGRAMLTAHTLPDGRVLIIGGSSQSAGGITDPLDGMEVFDPTTATFAAVPYKLTIGRTWHASALVRDGTVLVMGGYTLHGDCNSSVATVDQVDPLAGTVSPFALLLNTNTEWTAVTLLDGSVLGVGGGACGATMANPDIDFLPGAAGPN